MKAIDEDGVLIGIADRRSAVERSIAGIQKRGREQAEAFALADAANRTARAEAIDAGEIPPAALVPEQDTSAGAILSLRDEVAALNRQRTKRIGELCPEIVSEAAEVLAVIVEKARPAVPVLDEFTASMTDVLRVVVQARTAEATADPNRIERPHAGDRTRKTLTTDEALAVIRGDLDPLALAPTRPPSATAVQFVTEPEPRNAGAKKWIGIGSPPPRKAPNQRDPFL